MNYNSKTVTVKISRRELCDLLLSTTCIAKALKGGGPTAHKWEALHEKLKEQLAAFDAKDGVDNA